MLALAQQDRLRIGLAPMAPQPVEGLVLLVGEHPLEATGQLALELVGGGVAPLQEIGIGRGIVRRLVVGLGLLHGIRDRRLLGDGLLDGCDLVGGTRGHLGLQLREHRIDRILRPHLGLRLRLGPGLGFRLRLDFRLGFGVQFGLHRGLGVRFRLGLHRKLGLRFRLGLHRHLSLGQLRLGLQVRCRVGAQRLAIGDDVAEGPGIHGHVGERGVGRLDAQRDIGQGDRQGVAAGGQLVELSPSGPAAIGQVGDHAPR